MRCNCDEDTQRSSTLTSYLRNVYTPRMLTGITTQGTQILRIRLLTRVETCFPLHATISRCAHCCFQTLFLLWNKRESRILECGLGVVFSLAHHTGASAAGVLTPLAHHTGASAAGVLTPLAHHTGASAAGVLTPLTHHTGASAAGVLTPLAHHTGASAL